LSYGQSSSNKEGPIKLVLHKLVNQVQQKGKASAKQVYVLRDKKVLINPTRKADEQIVSKRSPRQGKNLFQQVKNYELYSLEEFTLARL
jgi:hypothetical protein